MNSVEVKHRNNRKEHLIKDSHFSLHKRLNMFEGVFQGELRAGLPPVRPVDYAIEVHQN